VPLESGRIKAREYWYRRIASRSPIWWGAQKDLTGQRTPGHWSGVRG